MGAKNNILSGVSDTSSDEFYTPIPKGYEPGNTKYVITFGTVMSGLGKGIFSSSLAKVLKDKGFRVSPIKLEGYLNIDSGTLNPFRHGEVFVLDDGMECDMDLGTYERLLDINLTKDNFSTNGQLFSKILENERDGKFLGRDVQFIPHVTGEIKLMLRELAMKSKADVVFVEIGGTVGDIENSHYIEAMRELAYEEGEGNVCFAALTYIIEPDFLGEQKSKAAQLGIRNLQSRGIQPHIIACRAKNNISQGIKEKISINANIPTNRVFDMHDVDSIYLIPSKIIEEKIDFRVLKILGLEDKADSKKGLVEKKKWDELTRKALEKPKKEVVIGITGKYTKIRDAYASILKALEHSGLALGVRVKTKWIETTKIESGELSVNEAFRGVDGVIIPGGFGKRGIEGKILCAKHARENKIPFLGICLGFQMAVIDYARCVCGLKGANSTEFEDSPSHKVIDYLPEQLKIEGFGGNMRLGGRDVDVKKNSYASKVYDDKTCIRERFRHRYEVNPEYIKKIEDKGLIFSGKAPNQPIMQILELVDHPYFVGVQYHPEFLSRPLRPAPLFYELVRASRK
ncbi:CTP synthase (glutamine hydrolyzing) [Candidatus Woesearchaeota archaeon]|nr:CTP synthase (glutamine hydrolyzing) [Candidatus Woesearchaeota archaeon]